MWGRALACAGLLILPGAASAEMDRPAVPNARTAIRIAEAVMEGRCGSCVQEHMPHVAELREGAWLVHGTLPKGWKGDILQVKIDANTGQILDITHGQ